MKFSKKLMYFASIIFLVLFINKAVATAEMEITDYPKEILVERGWLKYSNIIISNKGDTELHNIKVSVAGEFPDWFDFQPNKTDSLMPYANSTIIMKISVPSDANTDTYSFYLSAESSEIASIKSFTMKVFSSQTDLMLYQIQTLETKIRDIEKNITEAQKIGKNVESAKATLAEAKTSLEDSKYYVNNNMQSKATETIIDIENSISKIEYDLSRPQTSSVSGSSFPFEWLVIIPIILVLSIIFYKVKGGKVPSQIQMPIKMPDLNVKNIILEGNEQKNFEADLEKLRQSKKLLDDEFKQNLISRETYEELNMRYERDIANIENEIRKTKTTL